MVKIETLIEEGKILRIKELELSRYIHFFENSYKDNLEHSKAVIDEFPRWSIISGYYSMHDITKLLLAKEFGLKIELEVHATTIKAVDNLIKSREIKRLFRDGYKIFISLANDLAEGKKERVKAQYFTGTEFMKERYRKKAREFHDNVVIPYLKKIKSLIKEK
ncbi:hypothetical protein GF336_01725 [Candidatus Woesearchaeota archaeon]|nr:hypothetical protein [Candidatus Woesearchaeota archaeon]